MASASMLLGGIVLIIAGIYQWTPLKNACLVQCRTPFGFLMRHGGFRQNVPGCLYLGALHGTYCVGCCWVLMALLFVVGVMNVLWIALLALLVLLEKLTRHGQWIARAAGVLCVAMGLWMVLAPHHEPGALHRQPHEQNAAHTDSLPDLQCRDPWQQVLRQLRLQADGLEFATQERRFLTGVSCSRTFP
jgi:hypothetical protein